MSEVARTRQALRVRRMGIDTYREPVVYMRRDCRVCRSEGFEAQARVRVRGPRRSIIATPALTPCSSRRSRAR